ncbi:DNA-directed RNA polymerase subunit N [Candidatus Woesearchaeota archaeon]|nr:DNA-directed RNA polymerase subunit N [Candidatus Woesearchaeota archaeon]
MIVPIRCWSCGKPVGHLWEEFAEKTKGAEDQKKKVLDQMGLERYCCRTMLLTHVNLIEDVAQFKKF